MSNLSECVANLASPDETARAYAAEDLGYLNAPQSVAPLLERLANEPSAVVRDAIFQALARIESDDAVTGAIDLLTSDDPQIRNLAVNLLHRKGNQSIPFLKRAMQEGDRDTRKFVLDALSGMNAGSTEDIYAAALSDDDPNVVITAVENLGNLRAAAFRGQIEKLLQQEDAHPMLLAVCLEALAGIGNESSLAVIHKRFPTLAELPGFSLTPCLKAMGALGAAREFEQVLALLPARAPQLYPSILGALIQLYERCMNGPCRLPQPSEIVFTSLRSLVESSEPPPVRYQAARVLGFWPEREDVLASLVTCLSSLEKMVRLGAAEALKISNRPELNTILAAYEAEETDDEVNHALNR